MQLTVGFSSADERWAMLDWLVRRKLVNKSVVCASASVWN